MCALFILGRGTDLDSVSMLFHILIGTLSSFFHHFCEKLASVFHEYIYMPGHCQLATIWQLFFLNTLEWDFLDVWIETGWMVKKWLCCSSTSTFAIFDISTISDVLNGLRIKEVQLFSKFAWPSGAKRARATVNVRTCIVRLRERGNNEGGDMTRAEMLAGMAIKEGAHIQGRRSLSAWYNKPLFVDLLTEQKMEFVVKFSLNILLPTPKFLSRAMAGRLRTKKRIITCAVALHFFRILISKSFAGLTIFSSKGLHACWMLNLEKHLLAKLSKCSILRIFVSYEKMGSECKFCCHRVFVDSCSRLQWHCNWISEWC